MKFSPIGNQANISSSQFSSMSPSLKLDSMGFPHISWITIKNGFNQIHYKYWDGFNWNFIGDNPIVSRSKGDIYYSPNGLELSDEDSPIVAFAKKDVDRNNRICVAKHDNGEWNFNELEVNYDIKWIGAFLYSNHFAFSSSSPSSLSSLSSILINSTSSRSSISSPSSLSSILINSTSSPSSLSSLSSISSLSSRLINSTSSRSSPSSLSSIKINSTSSKSSLSSLSSIKINSTSSPSISYSSLSTSSNSSISISSRSASSKSSISSISLYSSSSRSVSSSSSKRISSISSSSTSISSVGNSESSSSIDSSSSSSEPHRDLYIVTYDGENIRIYSLSGVWILQGQFSENIIDLSAFKCSMIGNKIGMSYVNDSNVIKYNFFDLNVHDWEFASFKSLGGSSTNGTIIGFSMSGTVYGEEIFLYFSWIEDNFIPSIVSYTKFGLATDLGMEFNIVVDTENLSFISSAEKISASHKVTGICVDQNKFPIIFASGAKTSLFVAPSSVYDWTENKIDLDYSGYSVPNNVSVNYDPISDKVKVSFNNSESIVYFEEGEDNGFEIQTPKIIVLNEQGVYITNYKDSYLENGSNVSGITFSEKGAVLRDTINPIVLVDG